jgi:hypothetical protein
MTVEDLERQLRGHQPLTAMEGGAAPPLSHGVITAPPPGLTVEHITSPAVDGVAAAPTVPTTVSVPLPADQYGAAPSVYIPLPARHFTAMTKSELALIIKLQLNQLQAQSVSTDDSFYSQVWQLRKGKKTLSRTLQQMPPILQPRPPPPSASQGGEKGSAVATSSSSSSPSPSPSSATASFASLVSGGSGALGKLQTSSLKKPKKLMDLANTANNDNNNNGGTTHTVNTTLNTSPSLTHIHSNPIHSTPSRALALLSPVDPLCVYHGLTLVSSTRVCVCVCVSLALCPSVI